MIIPFVRIRIYLMFDDLYNRYLKEKDLLSFVEELKDLIDFIYEDCSFGKVAGCLTIK